MSSNEPLIETVENAPRIAARCVAMACEDYGIELDYSPSSLWFINDILDKYRVEKHTANEIETALLLTGYYTGEVFIRNGRGHWLLYSNPRLGLAPPGQLMIEDNSGGIVNPIGKAYKYYRNGAEDSLAFFYEVLTHRAAPQPEGHGHRTAAE